MPTMKDVICCICNKEYQIELKRYNAKINEGSAFYCSPECLNHKGSIKCTCATCGKEVWRTKSQFARSKSGNVFCNKHCATIFNNTKYKTGENHPQYINGLSTYRELAFQNQEHRCSICNWNEDERILEVHHIDENRENNSVENLTLLCPNCHRKITLGYYKLINSQLIKI